MKTAVFILAGCLLITISVSAQTSQEQKPDSIKIGYNQYLKTLYDTLKLENPFKENNFQSLSDGYNFPRQEQNLAQNYRFGKAYSPTYRMPIIRPDFNSKMPVAKPDSSVHYFLQVIKIGK